MLSPAHRPYTPLQTCLHADRRTSSTRQDNWHRTRQSPSQRPVARVESPALDRPGLVKHACRPQDKQDTWFPQVPVNQPPCNRHLNGVLLSCYETNPKLCRQPPTGTTGILPIFTNVWPMGIVPIRHTPNNQPNNGGTNTGAGRSSSAGVTTTHGCERRQGPRGSTHAGTREGQ